MDLGSIHSMGELSSASATMKKGVSVVPQQLHHLDTRTKERPSRADGLEAVCQWHTTPWLGGLLVLCPLETGCTPPDEKFGTATC